MHDNDDFCTVTIAETTHYTASFTLQELVTELGLTSAEIKAMSGLELYDRIRDNDALDEILKESDGVLQGTRLMEISRN